MIRPFTCVCFLLACGSGLYLYQAKHRVQVLDREIAKTVRATDEMREQIRVLHAEWTLENDPQRLQNLAEDFLTLKTVTPGQFTSMADLDSRLPALRPPEPPLAEPSPLVAQLGQPAEPVALQPPPPSKPAAAPVAAAAPPARPAEAKPPPRPALAEAAPPPRAPEPKPVPRPVVAEAPQAKPAHSTPPPRTEVAVLSRPASAANSAPAVTTAVSTAAGSALGMARGTSAALPRPMPVSASQWVSNGGGG